MRAMRALGAISLGVRFVMGATLGTALGVVFFFVALARAARPIHAEGVLCTGELLPRDPELGARLEAIEEELDSHQNRDWEELATERDAVTAFCKAVFG